MGHRVVPGLHTVPLTVPFIWPCLGKEHQNSFFLAIKALKRAEGGAECEGEWMGGRSGSTARGRWSFFRHSHLLCVRLALSHAAEVSSSAWGCIPHGATCGSILPSFTQQMLI